MLIDHWPLLGLRIVTPRLELRLPSGDELAELAELAAEGVHAPDRMPFASPGRISLPGSGPARWFSTTGSGSATGPRTTGR